jgi:hypothetical protein
LFSNGSNGRRPTDRRLNYAVFLAIAITTLMLLSSNSPSLWALPWSLVWPAWYIAAMAQGDDRKIGRNEETTT